MTATELSIIKSAKELFITNGYRGTSMREIATHAKVNLAMVNYYFRSKENLFDIIFVETVKSVSSSIIPAIMQEGDTLQKIERFIHLYIDGLMKNPAIPAFIFQEVINNPQKILDQVKGGKNIEPLFESFIAQMNDDVKKGVINPIDNPLNLFLNIVSLCAFPFIVKPVVEMATGIGNDKYMGIMESRKDEITKIIHDSLKS